METHIKERGTADFLREIYSPGGVPEGLLPGEKRGLLKLYTRKRKLEEELTTIRKRKICDRLNSALEKDYLRLEQYKETCGALFGEVGFQLTRQEIACVISEIDSVSYFPVWLPSELKLSPMTRESFAQGIAILREKMDRLEKTL